MENKGVLKKHTYFQVKILAYSENLLTRNFKEPVVAQTRVGARTYLIFLLHPNCRSKSEKKFKNSFVNRKDDGN